MIEKEDAIAIAIVHNRDDFNENDLLYVCKCIEDKNSKMVIFCDNSKAGQYINVTLNKQIENLIKKIDKEFCYVYIYNKDDDKPADRIFIEDAIRENLGDNYSVILTDTDTKKADIIW